MPPPLCPPLPPNENEKALRHENATLLSQKMQELERLRERARRHRQHQRSLIPKKAPTAARSNLFEARKGEPAPHWKAHWALTEQRNRKRVLRHEARVQNMHTDNDSKVDETVDMLRRKITEHTRGDHDRIRQACRVFGDSSGNKGINLREFRLGMRHWNIPLSQNEAKMVFSRLDTKCTGCIKVAHLFRKLFPNSLDFPADVWYNNSEHDNFVKEQAERLRKKEGGHSKFVVERTLTDQQLLESLRDRINERSRSSADRMRKAYRLFTSHDKVITFATFKHAMMVEFNLKVNDQQCRKLFRFFDSEDDGELSLHDLVHKLFPRSDDYPVKLWYIREDERNIELAKAKNRERQIFEERIPLPVRPKSARSKQRELTHKLLASSKSSPALPNRRSTSAVAAAAQSRSHRWRPGDTNWQTRRVGNVTFSERKLPWE